MRAAVSPAFVPSTTLQVSRLAAQAVGFIARPASLVARPLHCRTCALCVVSRTLGFVASVLALPG